MPNTSPRYCDIGVNLGHRRFEADRPEVMARAQAVGVSAQIFTGTSVAASIEAAQLAQQFSGCYYTAGVHPHDAGAVSADWLAQLRPVAVNAVAVGECGLDFDRDFSPRPTQLAVFEAQLALAAELKKPLFLHERAAASAQLALLRQWQPQLHGGVQHCFTGERDTLFAYLDLGLLIGITGWLCDERRGETLRQLVPLIPAERLLVETDAPFLLPRDLRPKPRDGRNEPAYLPHIVRTLAQLRGADEQQLSEQLWRNSCDFFGLQL
jgi:TatD DNase family protein